MGGLGDVSVRVPFEGEFLWRYFTGFFVWLWLLSLWVLLLLLFIVSL